MASCPLIGPNGNMLHEQAPTGTTYFSYTPVNLVESIHFPDDTWNYFHYDGRLRRYALQDSDGLHYLSWDDSGLRLLAVRDASGNLEAEYTHGYAPINGIGTIASARVKRDSVWEERFYLINHHGDVMKIYDETNTELASYTYNAWGQRLNSSEADNVTNWFQYQTDWLTLKDGRGKWYLSPTRIYSVDIGVYTSQDPLHGSYDKLTHYMKTNTIPWKSDHKAGATPLVDMIEYHFNGNSQSYTLSASSMSVDTWGLRNQVGDEQNRLINLLLRIEAAIITQRKYGGSEESLASLEAHYRQVQQQLRKLMILPPDPPFPGPGASRQEREGFARALKHQLEVWMVKHYKDCVDLDPCTLVAQWMAETGWGRKGRLIKETKNFGNIKGEGPAGFVYSEGAPEFINGRWVKEPSKFRKYHNFTEFYRDYFDTLASGRYSSCIGLEGPEYFTCIKRSGYATEPAYVKLLNSIYRQICD